MSASSPAPAGDPARRPAPRFVYLAGAIVALAVLLRLYFVFAAQSAAPIRGDINDYVLYAWNLNDAGVFSSTLPGSGPVVADSFRGPGYPVVLAAAMRLAGNARLSLREAERGRMELVADPPTWMTIVLVFQALCGALGVLLAIVLGRYWLAPEAALVAGLIAALSPHAIVFTGTMLSETVFGMVLLLAMLLLVAAERSRRVAFSIGAGVAFGAAYLINPVIALFPFVAALLLALRGAGRIAIALIAVFAVAPIAWSVRNATLADPSHGSLSRVEQNFVQGSWPQFLIALTTRFNNEISAEIVAAEAEEERQFIADPDAGFATMRERMALDPAYYARWYLFDKPYLLWGWTLGVGWDDIHFLVTPNSPFRRIPVLKAMKTTFAWANPVIFVLALAAALTAMLRGWRRNAPVAFAMTLAAWLVAYVTAVHTVLQAEPRYSIPYRPFELLLAVTTCAWLVQQVRARRVPAMRPG